MKRKDGLKGDDERLKMYLRTVKFEIRLEYAPEQNTYVFRLMFMVCLDIDQNLKSEYAFIKKS